MAKTTRNFKSKEAYSKWVAYGHMHKVFENSPGNTPVKIMNKVHKVVHSKKSKGFTGLHHNSNASGY